MWRNPYHNLPISGQYLVIACLLLSLLSTLQAYLNYIIGQYDHEFSWVAMAIRTLSNYLGLFLFTPVMAYSSFSLLETQKNKLRRVWLHIALSLFIAVLHRTFSTYMFNWLHSLYTGNPFSILSSVWALELLAAGLLTSILFYWMGVGVFMAAISQKKLINQERELANARVHALMTQLRPHFLFNTLNSISALIALEPEKAQRVIAQLGDLLRRVLRQESQQFVSLEEELAFIRRYLDIEKERYRERLRVIYEIDSPLLSAKVPNLILQPLVENAIKHGIAKNVGEGWIKIGAKSLKEPRLGEICLELSIENKGPVVEANVQAGIGLTNVKNRLLELYADKHEFYIKPGKESGCQVQLIIPLKPNL